MSDKPSTDYLGWIIFIWLNLGIIYFTIRTVCQYAH